MTGKPGVESGTPPARWGVGFGPIQIERWRWDRGKWGDRGESGGLGFAGWTDGGCRLGDGAGRPGGLVASWAGRPSGGGSLCLLFIYFLLVLILYWQHQLQYYNYLKLL